MLPSHVCYQISAPNWTFNHPQPGTCLSPNNPTIHSLVYKSAQHPISLEQTHDDFMMIHNQPIYPISTIQYQYKSSIFSTHHGHPPWIHHGSPSVAGRDLHNRLSAAAATLSRLQQLALEALPFLYAENGLGRVWSETFGALAKWRNGGKQTDQNQ